MDVIFQNYFKESLFDDIICEFFSSSSSESIKSTFAVSTSLKEPPSVLDIIFQRETYGMTNDQTIKNEHKVAIPKVFFYKIPSINDKISYTIAPMIIHDGDSLDC